MWDTRASRSIAVTMTGTATAASSAVVGTARMTVDVMLLDA